MRELLNKKLKEKGFLIAAHRGTFGANVVDNTYLSMKLALDLGADMVEVDVIKSIDNVLYAFHSGLEVKRFGRKINLLEMNSSEIDKLELLNQDGEPSGRNLEKLEDILLKLRGEILINVDRAWDYFDEVFRLIKKLGLEKQIIVKSEPKEHVIKFLKESELKLMFMPIIRKVSDLDLFLNENINTVAVEILFSNEDNELISEKFLNKLKEHNILLWINSIKLDNTEKNNLAARHDDDNALEDNGMSWKWLLDKGANIIQTDWPYFMNKFRNKIKESV